MPPPERLLDRLQAIGRALEATGAGLALIGLGSAGRETDRLDAWSDLDFFAIVEPGHKQRLLEDLSWLAGPAALVWHYRNTADGHKLLYEDGVFCECALFEPAELAGIPYAPGRIVWQRADLGEAAQRWAWPVRAPQPQAPSSPDWLVGEALGNLHVGLQRWRRGERRAAWRMIQVHAADRLTELALQQVSRTPDVGAGIHVDPYNPDRRMELRDPALAAVLPDWLPGLAHCPEAALAMLTWLEQRASVAPGMAAAIRTLAQG